MLNSSKPLDSEPAIESLQDRMIDDVTASQQDAIETLDTAGHVVFEGIRRTRQEISDFLVERIRQDLDTQQAMLRCRSVDEFRDLQARFLRTALDQYGGEASRLFSLGGELLARSLERGHA